VRFNEHKNAFKTNSHTSNFDKHLIEQARSFGSIQNKMQTLQRHNKGARLNNIEPYYIYAEFTKNNYFIDEHNISPNKIFEALLKPYQPLSTSAPTPSDTVTPENPPKHSILPTPNARNIMFFWLLPRVLRT